MRTTTEKTKWEDDKTKAEGRQLVEATNGTDDVVAGVAEALPDEAALEPEPAETVVAVKDKISLFLSRS